MENTFTEIEEFITKSLLNNVTLVNEVNAKELEKQDQLKAFAISIIDVLDSFENIETSIHEKGLDSNEDVSKTMTRYQSIKKKLLKVLQRHGITPVTFPDNRLIQGVCEVVETQPDESKESDEIIEIIRNGYIRGNELIRSAQLIIVKN